MSIATNRSENSSGGIKHETQKTQDGNGAMSHEFKKFLADIEDLVKATNLLTGEELARAKAELNERIEIAKHSLNSVRSDMVRRAQKTAEVTNKYVHKSPWQIIGAGSVIGFLLGVVIARRS